MNTHESSPTAHPHWNPADADTGAQDDREQTELTVEEKAALAIHHRHISETSYLPAPADYLHVR